MFADGSALIHELFRDDMYFHEHISELGTILEINVATAYIQPFSMFSISEMAETLGWKAAFCEAVLVQLILNGYKFKIDEDLMVKQEPQDSDGVIKVLHSMKTFSRMSKGVLMRIKLTNADFIIKDDYHTI